MWLALVGIAAEASTIGWYRQPALRGDLVVFTAEGDLWRVGVAGGEAQRLTSHPGMEVGAAITPDGAAVVFTAEYDGPAELYAMPSDGGQPRRLTWDGERPIVREFHPDGRAIVASRRHSELPDVQLSLLDVATGARERVPLSQASEGTVLADGTWVFTRRDFQGSHTRRYVGGTNQDLWSWKAGSEAKPLTANFRGTSKSPMAVPGGLAFVTDRDGGMDVWFMKVDGSGLKPLTQHGDLEVRGAVTDGTRIVYQLGADLRLLDVASGVDQAIPIVLVSDLDQMRPRDVVDPVSWTSGMALSPDGSQVAAVARGLPFTLPVDGGRIALLAADEGVRWREVAYGPDGTSVFSFSDATGEVELHRLDPRGMAPPKQITRGGNILRTSLTVAPAGDLVAFTDLDWNLTVVNTQTNQVTLVEPNVWGPPTGMTFSPDGRWLAYVAPTANTYGVIRLWSLDSPTPLDVTSDRANAYAPSFNAAGDILYFLSDQNLVSIVSSPWGLWQPEPFLDHTVGVFGTRLTAKATWPWRKRWETDTKEPEPAKEDDKKDDKKKDKPTPPIQVEGVGLRERTDRVPLPWGNYGAMMLGNEHLWVSAREAAEGSPTRLLATSIGDEPELKEVTSGIDGWELSADRKKLFLAKGSEWFVADAATDLGDLAKAKVPTSGWQLSVTPRIEWRQMFREAWRLERDYFYDPNLHHVDWPAVLKRFTPLVDRVTDRAELSDLLAQMVAELSALHIFVQGGDLRSGPDRVGIGAIGAELAPAASGFRVVRKFAGDPTYVGEHGPASREGVDLREGDVIEAFDGVAATTRPDAGAFFRGKVDVPVRLTVRRGAKRHDTMVVPWSVGAEADLRYDDWEESRRQWVETKGGGRIGYVHLRAMGRDNWTEWVRGFFPVFHRQGLIVDVRHNRGGNIDSWILEKLIRPAWFYWQGRTGEPTWNMQYAFRGHLAVLIDGHTASDGEAFTAGVQRNELGKVFGTRTWGGGIWLSFDNWLVDRGIASAAEYGVYGPEGRWLIEMDGVDPDVVVDTPPDRAYAGEDRVLDAALSWLDAEIARDPRLVPPAPPSPDKRSWERPPDR